MSKARAKPDMVLNKSGEEKPVHKTVRFFEKQRIKIEKNAKLGDHSRYVRNAIDAYEGD